jgi:hypothetical protein
MKKLKSFYKFKFLDTKQEGWYQRGRELRKSNRGALQRHCRHGFQVVEETDKGFVQICAKCFNTTFFR